MTPRDRVLWLGRAPGAEVARDYAQRRMTLEAVDAVPDRPGGLADVAAVVFACDVGNAGTMGRAMSDSIASLLDHGARVEVDAADDGSLGALLEALGKFAYLEHPHVRFRTAPPTHVAAEEVARHPRDPRPRGDVDVRMARNTAPLARADVPLFQRGFGDCRKVELLELGGGRSDARVFEVHVTVDGSRAGPRPQPMFAKVDRLDKIEREFANYREFGDRYVPFGNRPNVRGLVRGADRGLLVGDFVDRAEPLWDLVRRGTAVPAISSLFDDAMAGWRRQAYAAEVRTGSVATAMMRAGVCDPARILDEHVERSGSGTSREAVLGWLAARDEQRFRTSPIHGDLHGGNVMVRSGQSIVIDLASVRDEGPLTTDVASLEVWLAFELPPEADPDEFADPTWRTEVDRLYSPEAFTHPPGPGEPTSRLRWLTDVVDKLRQIGLSAQSCATEYQSAVAVQLLRRCQWPGPSRADQFRRAHGYLVASRLAAHLAGVTMR